MNKPKRFFPSIVTALALILVTGLLAVVQAQTDSAESQAASLRGQIRA